MIDQFLTWWYATFASFEITAGKGYLWFVPEDKMADVPHIMATVLLVTAAALVIDCFVLLFLGVKTNSVGAAFLSFVVALIGSFLALIGVHLSNSMAKEFAREIIPLAKEIFLVTIPAEIAAVDIFGLLYSIVAVILWVFSVLMHGALFIVGLVPVFGLIGFNLSTYGVVYGALRCVSSVGFAVLAMFAVAFAVFGMSVYILPMLVLGFGPVMAQGIREWLFVGGGGTIIKK